MNAIRRAPVSALAKYQAVTLDNIFATIIGQAMGFHFGKPKRVEDKALAVVLPILRDGEFARDYLTYSETDGVIATDSGLIDKVNLKNTTDQKVFIRSGTVFAGKGTQSRTITRSAVLFPGKEVALDARCVHRSHHIHQGSGFENYGTISIDVERSVYDAGFRPRSQGEYWQAVDVSNSIKMDSFLSFSGLASDEPVVAAMVEETIPVRGGTPPFRGGAARASASRGLSSSLGGSFRTQDFGRPQGAGRVPGQTVVNSARPAHDSFVAGDAAFAANLDDVLSKVKLHHNQVGISLITDRGVETVELFEVHQSWAALHKDSVKRMGTELIKEETEDVFEYKPEKAIEQVTRILGQDYDANVIYEHKADGPNRVVITGLTSASHIGEAVELGGKLIHLSLLKRAA